eukprot:scaffold1747_cov251-Pinguiococcus_pyrenoidosus.AAC.7
MKVATSPAVMSCASARQLRARRPASTSPRRDASRSIFLISTLPSGAFADSDCDPPCASRASLSAVSGGSDVERRTWRNRRSSETATSGRPCRRSDVAAARMAWAYSLRPSSLCCRPVSEFLAVKLSSTSSLTSRMILRASFATMCHAAV